MGLVDIICKCPEKIGLSLSGACCIKKESDAAAPAPPPVPAVVSSSIVFLYDDCLAIVGPGTMADGRIAEEEEPIGKWETLVLELPNKRIVSLTGETFENMCTMSGGNCLGKLLTEVFSGSFLSVLMAALKLLEDDRGKTIQFNCLYRNKPVTIIVYALFGTKQGNIIGATIVCRSTHYNALDLQKILAMSASIRSSSPPRAAAAAAAPPTVFQTGPTTLL